VAFDFGNNAITPGGVKDITLPANTVLPAGNYWIALQISGTGSPGFQTFGLTQQSGLCGSNNAVGVTSSGIQANIGATTSSPLPDPFPAGATILVASSMPIIQFQVA
jgi:hypothetical protein